MYASNKSYTCMHPSNATGWMYLYLMTGNLKLKIGLTHYMNKCAWHWKQKLADSEYVLGVSSKNQFFSFGTRWKDEGTYYSWQGTLN